MKLKLELDITIRFANPLSIKLETAPADTGIHTKLDKIMDEIEELTREVAETKTVMQSAAVLLKGLKDRLDAAGTDPVKLKQLREDLDTEGNALAKAITDNTPAAQPEA